MNQGLHYFVGASVPVKGVMLVLLAASIFSWSLVIHKWRQFRVLQRINKQFKQRFWSEIPLITLLQDYKEKTTENNALVKIFQTGYLEFQRAYQAVNELTDTKRDRLITRVNQAMVIARAKEEQSMQEHLSWLATIGSISPYVGLFGTVWGIMASLKALGGVQQATLSMVAPGISEALVATALGLFAAIPAMVAYNRLTQQSNVMAEHYAIFQEEFSALLENELSQA